MKYYIIAGEASGDLHGSNLIKELLYLDDNARIKCWGGNLMQNTGALLVKHYRDLAFMGFAEVVKNLPTIFKNLAFSKKDIQAFNPNVVVLIDYPGFNLRIAKWAKKKGFKVVYYISPQVWAWKENRVKQMKQCIDAMMVILPFEKDYFKNKWNWEVEYVGHPLVHEIEMRKKEILNKQSSLPQLPLKIALLPGSRKQEIKIKLPIMLSVAKAFPEYEFVVAKAPGEEDDFYEPFLKNYQNVSAVRNQTYALLLQSKAALVTSGTATLETALLGVPEVVCYKGSAISYAIAKQLINIKFIALVNLIMNKQVVKELIQNELTTSNLISALNEILNNTNALQTLQNNYSDLKNKLIAGGNASANAAATVFKWANV